MVNISYAALRQSVQRQACGRQQSGGQCRSPLNSALRALRFWRRYSACILLGIGLAMASGCDRPDRLAVPSDPLATLVHKVPETVPLKLALVGNADTPFWNLVRKGLAKFERETGVKVDVFIPAHGRKEEQRQILERLAGDGYHGVMVSVIAPDEQLAVLNQIATKMNLVIIDADVPSCSRLAFVGPRNYDAGVAAGMAIARLLPDGGKIAIFAGDLTAENVVLRLRGIKDTIRDHNIEIVALRKDRVSRDQVRQQVEEVLQVMPDVNLLAGLWSYNGPVIREVLKSRGRAGQVKVVAFDEEEGTLQGIEDGTIDCSVALTPFDYSYLGARLLRDLARSGAAALPREGEINTGFLLVNRYNVAEFRETLARQDSY